MKCNPKGGSVLDFILGNVLLLPAVVVDDLWKVVLSLDQFLKNRKRSVTLPSILSQVLWSLEFGRSRTYEFLKTMLCIVIHS